jgi:uncharacterized membrane protein YhiD involved in acid resistance
VELTETYHLALSLGLGLLVGFQRKWAAKQLAGIRTFPLVALLGPAAAALGGGGVRCGDPARGWAAAVLAVLVALGAGFVGSRRRCIARRSPDERGLRTLDTALDVQGDALSFCQTFEVEPAHRVAVEVDAQPRSADRG